MRSAGTWLGHHRDEALEDAHRLRRLLSREHARERDAQPVIDRGGRLPLDPARVERGQLAGRRRLRRWMRSIASSSAGSRGAPGSRVGLDEALERGGVVARA